MVNGCGDFQLVASRTSLVCGFDLLVTDYRMMTETCRDPSCDADG